MLKRIFSIFAIALIITGLFFEGYSLKCPVFADTTTDEWTQVTTNAQLVEAFRYYCKSRDLTIEGSSSDAITNFSTKAFNGICNTLGIDVTALQAQIKYQTDGNIGTRFLFSALGIDAYNRIFAQFLQDNDLSVGDSANENDNTVFNGKKFIDDDGYNCYITFINTTDDHTTVENEITLGSPYRFTSVNTEILNSQDSVLYNLNYHNSSYNYYINNTLQGTDYNICLGKTSYITSYSGRYGTYSNVQAKMILIGFVTIYENNAHKFYLGTYRYNPEGNWNGNCGVHKCIEIDDISDNVTIQNVYLTTNNTVINNNNYEGDTIINNNGTTGDDDSPINPPDPDDPTPDPPTLPDDGGWQDFQLPDMPNDWLIYGMEKKFPFDIPFNIMFGLSLLNHEPEIPKFEGDIDLKVCTWHYDIDLTPFDGIAQILRKFEVLAFIIGLAILTKELIMWG